MEIVAQDNTRDKLSHEKEKGKLILASPPSRINPYTFGAICLGVSWSLNQASTPAPKYGYR